MKIRHIAMDQGAESMAPLSLRVHRRGLVTELTLEEATPGVTEDTSGSVGKLSFTGPFEKPIGKGSLISTLQGTNISSQMAFWRWFSKLPQVGYVNPLEGTASTQKVSEAFNASLALRVKLGRAGISLIDEQPKPRQRSSDRFLSVREG